MIRFLLGDQTEQIPAQNGQTMLLDWLREERLRKGTKEGCNEGDCGACTVVITRLEQGQPQPRAVNACLVTLASLHGAHVMSVEDLAEGQTLHPVQQAMVDHHGSQCGFCTPGFVMSMAALHHNTAPQELERKAIERALSGNLCRCTGYAPIIRAMQASLSDHMPLFDEATMTRRLQALEADCISIADPVCSVPSTLDEALDALELASEPTIVAGMTDVGIWTNKQLRRLPSVVSVSQIKALQAIDVSDSQLSLGGAVTWQAAYDTLVDCYPGMTDMLDRFASMPIRNRATIGGNIANGSPVGDGPPAFMALGATIELTSKAGKRQLSLDDFYLGYQQKDLQAREILTRIDCPRLGPQDVYRVYKISKRIEQDISAVLGAFLVTIEAGMIVNARIAYGGMAAIPKRAKCTEAALMGQPANEITMQAAMDALPNDFKPIDDLRATAHYRMTVAQNLLVRLFGELQTQTGASS